MTIHLHSRAQTRGSRRLSKSLRNTSLTVFLALILICFAMRASNHPKPPATRTDSIKETLHGVEVVDAYRWLENQDEVTGP